MQYRQYYKEKTYNLYRNGILYEAERIQLRPKFPIDKISI
jgi:hypothetical protein